MTETALIDARGIHTYYGRSHILHCVDFAVRRGETVGLMGRNGMGKTTLVPTIDSLERKGFVLRQRDPNDRRRVPISLTEEGTKLIHEISMVGDDDPILSSLQKIGLNDSEKLVELIRKLVSHLKEGEEILEVVQILLLCSGEILRRGIVCLRGVGVELLEVNQRQQPEHD